MKELTKRLPSREGFDGVGDELLAERNDRGCALIAGSLVETIVRAVIKRNLVPLTENEMEGVFGRDAPLSTFSHLIRVGHAFGFFDAEIKRDLDRLREIRNAFAHAMTPVTFETPEIAAATKDFICLKIFQYDDLPWPKKHPRNQFMSAVGVICRVFGNVQTATKPPFPLTYAQPIATPPPP